MAGGQLSTALRQLRQLLGARQSVGDSDEQLVQRFVAQRDEEAFAALVHRHGSIVLGVCRRLLTEPSDVEDAFQAAFLILLHKAASIAHPERLGPWLHGVAYRVSVRARKQAARRRACEAQVPAMSPADASAVVAWRELRPLLDEEINRLPEKYRVPFILCHLEGKTNEEAARCLGCPKGTVLSRLARARERLRKRLVQRGITLSSAALAAVLAENAVSASVPLSLVAATASAVMLRDIGTAATPAALLAKGAMHAMFWTQMKGLAFVLLVLGVAGASAGMLTHWALAEKQTAALPATEAVPPKDTAPVRKKEDAVKASAAGEKDDDPLPPGAASRMGRLRFHHGESIRCLAFSPDGKLLASAGENLRVTKDMEDRTICLWDAVTGKELARLQERHGTLWSLAFAPDGKMLATGVWQPGRQGAAEDASSITLWDLAKKETQQPAKPDPKLRELDKRPGYVTALALSPDGKLLASATQHQQDPSATIRLWDVATGKEVRHWTGHRGRVNALAFAPDGQRLASASSDGTVLVWKVE